jgi:Eukaryotic-type carbonic anhydrase
VWARLFPQAGGARQSPVDIATSIASGDSKLEERKLTVNYQTKDGLRMLNTGQGWKVEAPMPESSKCFMQLTYWVLKSGTNLQALKAVLLEMTSTGWSSSIATGERTPMKALSTPSMAKLTLERYVSFFTLHFFFKLYYSSTKNIFSRLMEFSFSFYHNQAL